MARGMTRDQEMARAAEIEQIGRQDSERLHGSMNNSGASESKRENKQPDRATGRRDGAPGESNSQDRITPEGSKRRASAGAGPAEPTPATAEKKGNRATTRRATDSELEQEMEGAPTRRNDMDTKVNTKPMKGSSQRAKHFT